MRTAMVVTGAIFMFCQPIAYAQPASPGQPPIFGSELMTPEERDAYRQRMWSAQNPEARDQVRREHHEQMVQRAKERGVTLPEEPLAERGPGWGPQPGMGPGMAPGPGSGPGPMGPRRGGER